MAGDWLKRVKGFSKKREVVLMASMLQEDRRITAERCFDVWEWCDDNVSEKDFDDEGNATVALGPTGKAIVDSIAGVAGFADALAAAGWLKIRSGSLTFPNFSRHNGSTAKQRCANTSSQQRSRERRATSKRKPLPRQTRRDVFARDGHKCVYCGFSEEESNTLPGPYYGAVLSVDHVIPVARGGTDDYGNLATACSVCNMSKTSKTPEEAGLTFKRGIPPEVQQYVTDFRDGKVTREEKRRDFDASASKYVAADGIQLLPPLNTPECREHLQKWISYKAKRGQPYKSLEWLTDFLRKWAKHGPDVFCRAVVHSIGCQHQGLYMDPDDKDKKSNGQRQQRLAGIDDAAAQARADRERFAKRRQQVVDP